MSQTPPSAAQQRTKTFTGCWTCRGRKIKCDLTRPFCTNCAKAHLKCEGYTVKLKWGTGKGDGNGNGAADSDDTFQRRNVEFVVYPKDMQYETYEDMDDHLARLHAPELPATGETLTLGPFGVFEGVKLATRKTRKRKRKGGDDDRATPKLGGTPVVAPSGDSSQTSTPLALLPVEDGDEPTDIHLFGNGHNHINTGTSVAGSVADSVATPGGTAGTGFGGGSEHDPTRREYEALQELLSTLVGTDLVTMMPHDVSPSSLFATVSCDPVQHVLSLDGKFALPTQSLFFTAQSRYLLDHYIQRVIPIMTVVTHPKNPWRTIYLPRALSAIGDLISVGRTSSARNALLHALLASSAFNLKSRFPDGSEAQKHYFQLGVRLKSEAYIWLGDCLGRDLSKQKYKDVVTAVLSMVTIDVLWGSMSDCQLHLAAVESIIDLRYKTRPKMSRKAKILHRIAGMYALLQRSTVMDGAFDEVDNEQWLDIKLEDLEPNAGVAATPADTSVNTKAVEGAAALASIPIDSTLTFMNDPSQFEEYWLQYAPEHSRTLPDEFYERELISMLAIYGIPDSLCLLFNKACKVSRAALHCRLEGKRLPRSVRQGLAELESALVSWTGMYDVHKNKEFVGVVQEAVDHHIVAFHESLGVYHYRLARDINPKALGPRKLAILEHMEAIVRLNEGKDPPLAVPLLFPAFMAACELIPGEEDMRRRWESWFSAMRVQGLGSYYAARGVVDEVWRRRWEGAPGADWWTVVQEKKVNIMLI